MVSKLSELPEESIRQFLVDNLRPSEMEDYDPQQDNPTTDDALVVTNDQSEWSSNYPLVFVDGTDPTVPGGGETNYTAIQPDGSGPIQDVIANAIISVQATDDQTYGTGNVEARTIIHDIYQECHHQIQNNATTAITDAQYATITPPTLTKSTSEDDAGSTTTWKQLQGTASFRYRNTP